MSIQIYILSKLMDENNYPYKLKKQLSDPIPFDKLGNLSESKLYYHFDTLTKQGLIKPIEIIKEENRPDKQVFAITDKGRAELPDKMYRLFEKAESISEMIVGLVYIRFADRDKVIEIIGKKIEGAHRDKEQFKQIYQQVQVMENIREVADFMNGYLSARNDESVRWLEILLDKLKTKAI